MKLTKRIYLTVLSVTFLLQLTGCVSSQTASSETGTSPNVTVSSSAATPTQQYTLEKSASMISADETNMNHVTIEVGGKSFSATLADNEAARAFAAYLPMTVQMGDLNGQEKFYDLPDDLPANSTKRPSTIHSGDIFCWSGNTLVLFYKTFSNSYGGYVRLGTVDDPTELAAALGSDSVAVTWSLTK